MPAVTVRAPRSSQGTAAAYGALYVRVKVALPAGRSTTTAEAGLAAVSYTHLTLPTSDLV